MLLSEPRSDSGPDSPTVQMSTMPTDDPGADSNRPQFDRQVTRILEQILALDAQYRGCSSGSNAATLSALRECVVVLQRLRTGLEADSMAAHI